MPRFSPPIWLVTQTLVLGVLLIDVNVHINSLKLIWVFYEIVNITDLTFGSGDNDVAAYNTIS